MPQRALLRTAQEIAKGMDYIHSFGIIHGDLKLGNVLLKTHRVDRRGYVAKVSDFGMPCSTGRCCAPCCSHCIAFATAHLAGVVSHQSIGGAAPCALADASICSCIYIVLSASSARQLQTCELPHALCKSCCEIRNQFKLWSVTLGCYVPPGLTFVCQAVVVKHCTSTCGMLQVCLEV